MKHPQFTFELSRPPDLSPSAFARSAANTAAWRMISVGAKWPNPTMAIVGPQASGKSHLGTIWADRVDADILALSALAKDHLKDGLAKPLWLDHDGAPFDETALFHALNMATEEQSSILLTTRHALAKWEVALPDLSSRLKAIPQVQIMTPDDALLEAILIKRFGDLGITADPAVIAYVLARLERSYGAIDAAIRAFDQRTLAAHRRATVPLAAEVLDELLGEDSSIPESAAPDDMD